MIVLNKKKIFANELQFEEKKIERRMKPTPGDRLPSVNEGLVRHVRESIVQN